MSSIRFVERDMTEAEFTRLNAGFDEHTIEHGNPVEMEERHGFIIMDGDAFIGSANARLLLTPVTTTPAGAAMVYVRA